MTVERDGAAAATLANGVVLIVGGEGPGNAILKSAELFNPATGAFTKAPGDMTIARFEPSAATLPDGRVLVTGGETEGNQFLKSTEVYDPNSGTFSLVAGATHEFSEGRREMATATLQNGKVLLAGGYTANGTFSKATFLIDPLSLNIEAQTPETVEGRIGAGAAVLADGRTLVVGGENLTAEDLRSAEIRGVDPPGATTGVSSGVTTSAATVAGSSLSEAVGTARFQYGTSTAYTASSAPQAIPASLSARPLSAVLGGLAAKTTYHYRLVVENAGGASFGADQTFTTAPAALPIVKVKPLAKTPVISGASQSHSLWRLGSSLARLSRLRVPVGTTFSLSLNEAATLSFAFTQRVGGRKVRGRCVAPSRSNRRKRFCRRTVTRATLSMRGHKGKNKLAFQGRISRSRKLRPGTYTVVITAFNGLRRSGAKRLTFTIVR
jgi:hypothetical protein